METTKSQVPKLSHTVKIINPLKFHKLKTIIPYRRIVKKKTNVKEVTTINMTFHWSKTIIHFQFIQSKTIFNLTDLIT